LEEDVNVEFKSVEETETSKKYLVYKDKYLKHGLSENLNPSSNISFKKKYFKYKAKYLQ
jgi:hypothetical protein